MRIGDTSAADVEALRADLTSLFAASVEIDARVVDPAPAFSASRGQYDSRKLMAALVELGPAPEEAILGIADVDLFASIFTFVFGEAHLGGAIALVSTHRLRPEHYGLAPDAELTAMRVLTESVHEIGHLFGATHCRVPACVMNFSGAVEEIDLKRPRPCPECADVIGIEVDADVY